MINNKVTALKVVGLNKTFVLPTEKTSSIKSAFIDLFRKSGHKKLKILNDINFDIKQGEFFGVVGKNGSGKSTLLKLLAGIYSGDSGEITINGKLTPFIELGVGFNPELTGKENVYLNGALLGFSRKVMKEIYHEIVEFSELKDFMDQKLKNYSSGMQVRLAFSIAIRAESDILLIDEVLAVGDAIFQKKCFNYFKELKKRNKTVVFISHDAASLMEFCDRGIFISDGEIKSSGEIKNVVNDYLDSLNKEGENKNKNQKSNGSSKRWGSGNIEVAGVFTKNSKDEKQTIFTEKDKNIYLDVRFKSKSDIKNPVYGVTVYDASDQIIFSSNTKWQNIKTKDAKKNEYFNIIWEVPNIFNTGKYFISPAAADEYGSTIYDWRDKFASFEISKNMQSTAIINVNSKILFK